MPSYHTVWVYQFSNPSAEFLGSLLVRDDVLSVEARRNGFLVVMVVGITVPPETIEGEPVQRFLYYSDGNATVAIQGDAIFEEVVSWYTQDGNRNIERVEPFAEPVPEEEPNEPPQPPRSRYDLINEE